MKKFSILLLSFAFTGTIFAAEALKPAKVADFKGYTANVKEIANGIRLTGNGRYFTVETVKKLPIDLNKKYNISFEYRIAAGSKADGRFFFAPICYTKQGKEITAVSQNCVAGSDTVLAAAAKKGDKLIKIKNGAKWILKYGAVAFNTKADYSDLPNFDHTEIAAIKQNGDIWEISLKKPLAKAYPAGTAVREHRYAATYRYMVSNAAAKAQWQKFSRDMMGSKRKGVRGYASAWRPGTAFATITIFSSGKPVDLELRNISIAEVK